MQSYDPTGESQQVAAPGGSATYYALLFLPPALRRVALALHAFNREVNRVADTCQDPGVALAKVAARCMAGRTLQAQGVTQEITPPYFSVKEAVFPFVKFPGVDTILGPEMKSTGEVMGVGTSFAAAFVKSQLGAGVALPQAGTAFLTLKNTDKARGVDIARDLAALGFALCATRGTAAAIAAAGLAVQTVNKVAEGRPHIVDMIKNGDIALVINTVEERRNAIADSRAIRTSALLARVTTFTTIFGAEAAVQAMQSGGPTQVHSLQELHAQLHAQ